MPATNELSRYGNAWDEYNVRNIIIDGKWLFQKMPCTLTARFTVVGDRYIGSTKVFRVDANTWNDVSISQV